MRRRGEEISPDKDTKLWRKTLCSWSESWVKLQINAQLKGILKKVCLSGSFLFLSGSYNSIVPKWLRKTNPCIGRYPIWIKSLFQCCLFLPQMFFFLITHFSALFSCNMSKLSTALKHWTVNKQLDFSLDIWSASKSLWGQFYINLKSDSVLLKRKRKQRVIESLMIRQSGGYLRWSHRCHHLFSLFS